MTLSITHTKVATLPDEAGAEVNKAEWNANHTLTGTLSNAQIGTGIDAAKLADGSVSNTEFQYLDGASSNIQTQITAKFTLPSLTTGSVLFSNGITIAQDNANFFWDDTNNRLGIGTTSPKLPFEVLQTSAFSGFNVLPAAGVSSGNRASFGLGLDNGTSSTTGMILGRSLDTSANDFYIYDVLAGATRLVINSSGNVGVGTTTPALNGAIPTAKFLTVASQTDRAVMEFWQDKDTATDPLGQFSFWGGHTTPVQYSAVLGGYTSANNGYLQFYTNGGSGIAARWKIDSSGNLLASTDNSWDIGASGATRPRNVYVAGTGTYGGVLAASNLSGTNTGDQTITLTGAVTGSGTGSFATTIATPGTLTVASTNSTATAHTHAVTSSSSPGAAASILATDSSGILGSTGTRIVKIWATDLTVTNNIAGSITGNAATVTTNANLTGAVTSVGNATSLGSFTSAQLASALTNESGSGLAVFNDSPTLINPALGTPASGVATNLTGTATALNIGGNAATATALQNARTINGVTFDGTANINVTNTQESIAQASHGLSVGHLVYYTGSAYAKAKADAASTSEVVGIVSVVTDANNFIMVTNGRITTMSGLTAGTVYFLDASTAGAYTTTETTTVGQVSKPILVAYSTTAAYFVNYRGMLVTASNNNFAVSTKTTTYTITASDDFIRADATSAGFTVNLPTAVGITGRVYTIKKIDSTGNVVTIDPAGAELIDGASTKTINTQYTSYQIISNNVGWDII